MAAVQTRDLRAVTLRAVADGEVRREARPGGRCGAQALFLLANETVDDVVRELWRDGLLVKPGAGPPALTIDGWRALREQSDDIG